MVKLSNNHRTAERRRPYDEFNNGVVLTHRTLDDDELFEVRMDRLVEKWSGELHIRRKKIKFPENCAGFEAPNCNKMRA